MQLEIVECIQLLKVDPMIEICVALPNKRDKLELIVQKLTEIGVARITCWPAQRSQLQEIPAKKLERLETIVREAAEQARLHHIPILQVYTRNMWTQHYQGRSMIVFDLGEHATTP
jgi:RsmE family RNA methyltransferase